MTNPEQHIELWNRFLSFVHDNIDEAMFDAWFRPLSSMSFEDGCLTLDVPSEYFIEQIEAMFPRVLQAGLRKVYGDGLKKLCYHYYQINNEPDTEVIQTTSYSSPAVGAKPGRGVNPFVHTPQVVEFDPQLNPKYNFENYCCSASNKIALSIGESIANNPRMRTFNPLFVFGPSGCGKTHLIQAIGIRIKERDPRMRVLYVPARLFETQFTQNIKDHINDFYYFYQSIDVLIIDDIQDFIGKPKTQNAFYYIFNHLIQNGRHLILSSDCRPAQMEGMEARLLSRFRQGMTCELERPDYELRLSVLKMKAEQDGLRLPEEVMDFIAENVTDSIRELEGIVVSLIAHATVLNCDIDLSLARTVVGNAVKINKRQLNFEMIADTVAQHYGLETDVLFTKTRKRDISDARQLVMYLAKKHAKMSFKAIGLRLDRTHATVLYACNQTEQRLPLDKKLRDDVAAIEKALLNA